MDTSVIPFDDRAVEKAARLVLEGRPVAVPTETVYGLAADATSADAVAAVYAAKGRPSFNPLIVHAADLASAASLAEFGEPARRLAERFWPGPLTLVLPLRPGSGLSSLVTAGLGTVAMRVPAHRAIRALLEATGRPLAAPSANASGGISPTRAEHVAASLAARIPLILDDGPCPCGVESTIVQVLPDEIRLLRPGPVFGIHVADIGGLPLSGPDADAPISAPGQLASHYAPAKPLRLNASGGANDEWMIGFGPVGGHDTLSSSGSLPEAAARLFDCLHRADASAKAAIAVAPVPERALGTAINDRLRRAAAPRE